MALKDITNVVEEPSFADRGCKPKFGMEFDSEEIAYKFYNEYAGKMGFSIRKEAMVKNKRTSEVTSRIFVCSKEGFRSKDKRDSLTKHPRAKTRTGCDTQMSIKLNRCGNKCIVNHFEEVHNHALVTQNCAHMLPSQHKISSSQATELELAEEFGISIKNSYELMGRQSGGRESLRYIKQDIKNYLQSKRQRQLAFGEARNAAMAKAISSVMADTYHRLCTWHIMQNAFKKVNQLLRGPGGVNKVLSKFMYCYDEEDEFLAAWEKMLTEYNLHENVWFKRTFEVRKKWAYIYVRWTWSAGLKSTQVSESINSDLKDYLQSDHDLVQIFKHFERVLNDKRYKELEVEYALCQKIPQSTVVDGEDIAYTVADVDTSKEFRVIRKKIDNSLSCSCRLFEMNGVLCGHAIQILREVMNLKELPSEYILKRWTRKARSESVKDMDERDIQVDARLQHTTWYRNLCSIFTKISSRGAKSEETYKDAVERANELSNIIEEMLSSQLYGSSHENDDQGSALIIDNDSNRVQAKGFKKREGSRGRKRMKSQLAIAYMRKLRQLSNKCNGIATVQAKGTKRKSQALKSTCGRKSIKRTSKASPSSKETAYISINIVPKEVDNPLPLPQIPLMQFYLMIPVVVSSSLQGCRL
ncbi:hypothetical protein EZV62_012274 [Acer yangbiense]|uniref:SWIM-type domain-containing protein n=1 Tax=Acer yangbiense TaxID=1000413 RepID=A0A5C7HUY3_9ROSI|nr:hypothetical protein EZV62_012274 [Acer yangbiense]